VRTPLKNSVGGESSFGSQIKSENQGTRGGISRTLFSRTCFQADTYGLKSLRENWI
jgi:hypothetical protein